MRRSLLRTQDTARTLAVRRSSLRSESGTAPSPAACVASAASRAAVSRSESHVMRKLATEGTKIRTSASMTKTIVNSSNLAERPKTRRSALRARGAPTFFTRLQNLPGQESASSIMSRGTHQPRRLRRGQPNFLSQPITLRTSGLAAAVA